MNASEQRAAAMLDALSNKRVYLFTVAFEYVRWDKNGEMEFLVPVVRWVERTSGWWIFRQKYTEQVVDYYKALGAVIEERLPQGAKILDITFDWCHKKSVVLYVLN